MADFPTRNPRCNNDPSPMPKKATDNNSASTSSQRTYSIPDWRLEKPDFKI